MFICMSLRTYVRMSASLLAGCACLYVNADQSVCLFVCLNIPEVFAMVERCK